MCQESRKGDMRMIKNRSMKKGKKEREREVKIDIKVRGIKVHQKFCEFFSERDVQKTVNRSTGEERKRCRSSREKEYEK
ncbi:hypothetical protein TNCV_168401 [Trichonephila clavipes]|nr:hypothetical protein TNCV_168401 [Trichonephila clavipes]